MPEPVAVEPEALVQVGNRDGDGVDQSQQGCIAHRAFDPGGPTGWDDDAMPPPSDQSPWIVAVLCGASGVGKTTVATALAARHRVPLAEADDLVTAVKAVTTAEQQPILHYWDLHPQARAWSVDEIVDLHLQVAEVMAPAFRAVVADHVEFGARVVLEGDYCCPSGWPISVVRSGWSFWTKPTRTRSSPASSAASRRADHSTYGPR